MAHPLSSIRVKERLRSMTSARRPSRRLRSLAAMSLTLTTDEQLLRDPRFSDPWPGETP